MWKDMGDFSLVDVDDNRASQIAANEKVVSPMDELEVEKDIHITIR